VLPCRLSKIRLAYTLATSGRPLCMMFCCVTSVVGELGPRFPGLQSEADSDVAGLARGQVNHGTRNCRTHLLSAVFASIDDLLDLDNAK
jgi:hypothetical protein